ncbi:LysR family transcriptional regulator [Roseobacter sp.]|uniref:LysR family transcriptional regulator n=1 Tax=Roseobacter sp. TaxID=1907202 RepID=UPI00385C6BC8
MEHWLEFRTAYRLAKLGTVSATANDLGVHRATVNRHVDIIEKAFGTKFFQRHARGYTLTDAGQDLLDVASRADELISDLAGRSQGKAGQLTGSLLITSLSGLAPLIMPAIARFGITHPDIKLAFSADEALARLEYGEAHIAVRAGARPQEQDYVVLPFCKLRFGLYAAQSYVDHFGRPNPDDISGRKFIGAVTGGSRLPFTQWMTDNVAQDHIALETMDPSVIIAAIESGLGLGFLTEHDARTRPELVEVIAPQDVWSTDLWIVTHVDLHRTQKVQEFLKCLRLVNEVQKTSG